MWGRCRKVMIEAGAKAPTFRLKSLDGGVESLEDIISRGPALLVYFKIGCPVCQLTFPFLERLATSTGVQIVGISQDDDGATRNFNDRFGVTFLTLLDPSKQGYPASNAYGISSVPSFFLVETDGHVSAAFNGFSKRDIELLGQRAGVPPFLEGEHVPEWKAG
jgi:peroxiredoxin